MDKKITAILGLAVFLLFVGGLAKSIGQIPFAVIVVIVCAMTIYGVYEELREDQDTEES